MNLRATGLVAWGLMLVLVAFALPWAWNTAQARKTAYLLLNGRTLDARARPKFGGLEGNLAAYVSALHWRDQDATASTVLDQLDAGSRDWWQAIAAMEAGAEDRTETLLRRVAMSSPAGWWSQAGGLRLSWARVRVARNLTSDRIRAIEAIPEALEIAAALTPVERRVITGLAGSLHFQEGNWNRAADLVGRSVDMGTRSPVLHARAVAGLALDGLYGEARLRADSFASPEAINLAAIEQCRRWEGAALASSLSPVFDLGTRRRSAAVARAVDWLETQEFLRQPDSAKLPVVVPQLLGQDPIRLWFAGERMEAVGRSTEAYAMYERLQQLRPTLAAAVRMGQIAGISPAPRPIDPADFIGLGKEALYAQTVSGLVEAGAMPMKSGAAAILRSEIAVPVMSAEDADYELVMIAAADPGSGPAPVVSVGVGEEWTKKICVHARAFEAYRVAMHLPSRPTTVTLRMCDGSAPGRKADDAAPVLLTHVIIARQDSTQPSVSSSSKQ